VRAPGVTLPEVSAADVRPADVGTSDVGSADIGATDVGPSDVGPPDVEGEGTQSQPAIRGRVGENSADVPSAAGLVQVDVDPVIGTRVQHGWRYWERLVGVE